MEINGSYSYPILSNYESDQAKVDDFFSTTECLSTPDIVEMVYNVESFFQPQSEKATKNDLMNDLCFPSFEPSQHMFTNGYPQQSISPANSNSSCDRKSYSPYLESSEVNLESMNSPEMAPVSPNKVCPQPEYSYSQYDSNGQLATLVDINTNTVVEAEIFSEFGFVSDDQQGFTTQPVFNDNLLQLDDSLIDNVSSNYYQSQQSIPTQSTSQMISQSYPILSNSPNQIKSFATLDNVQCNSLSLETGCLPPSEPLDQLYQSPVPTVVAESLYSDNSRFSASPDPSVSITSMVTQAAPAPIQSFTSAGYTVSNGNVATTNSTTSQGYYYQQNSVPSTVSASVSGRKRTANSVFGATSSGTSGQKKQRITKREKQKMMDQEIENFEKDNKKLKSQVELLEKQIRYCKKFLNENVAPVLQKQQMQQNFLANTICLPKALNVEA